jgi:hypothetical protein
MTAVSLVIVVIFVPTPFAISQVPDISKYKVKIAYPSGSQIVPVGELTKSTEIAIRIRTVSCPDL